MHAAVSCLGRCRLLSQIHVCSHLAVQDITSWCYGVLRLWGFVLKWPRKLILSKNVPKKFAIASKQSRYTSTTGKLFLRKFCVALLLSRAHRCLRASPCKMLLPLDLWNRRQYEAESDDQKKRCKSYRLLIGQRRHRRLRRQLSLLSSDICRCCCSIPQHSISRSSRSFPST